MSDLPDSLRRARAQAAGDARPRTGPALAIAATDPRVPVPYGRPLDMRPRQGMRRIQQGDFAQSRGMQQESAQYDWAHGRTLGDRLRGGLSLAADMTGIPAALNAVQAAQHGDALSAAMNGGEAALNFAPEISGAVRPLARVARGLFGNAAREAVPAAEAAALARPEIPAPLPMDQASRMARAAQPDLFPETAPGPLRAYHGTRSNIADGFAPFSHFGTERAAQDRVRATEGEIMRRDAHGQANIIPVEIAGRRVDVGAELPSQFSSINDVADLLLRGGHISPEDHAYAMAPLADGQSRFLGQNAEDVVRDRLQEIARRNDIGAIGYRNAVEDAGSRSYIVPDPRNVRAIERNGLDMSHSARMARAREAGFDTETPLYHGMPHEMRGDHILPTSSFGTGSSASAPEINLTVDPSIANHYAGGGDFGEGAAVYPVFARRARDIGGWNPEGERVVLEPHNIRSVFAAFDPAKSGSSDLLAGVPIALTAGLGAAATQQKPRHGLFGSMREGAR